MGDLTAMDRFQIELPAPGFDRPGTVVRYGHYGRPVLVFPSEQGRAWDYENNGMVGAIADLVEGGRVKLYCVDSYDAHTWSNSSIPLEARAQRHGAYESWITDQVAGFIGEDSPGVGEVIVTGCSLGAYHALNFTLTRADLFPVAICQSGNYDPSQWHAWGDRGDAAYFTNPSRLRPEPARRPPRVAAQPGAPRAHRGRGSLGDRADRVAALGPAHGRPARREGHLPRPRRLGPRLGPRLALVAETDRAPPAPVLLGGAAWVERPTPTLLGYVLRPMRWRRHRS